MNLVEQLIRADKDKAKEKETKKIVSRKLSRLLGEEVEITIKELSGRRINDIGQMIVNKKGEKDYSKSFDMNLMYCVYGIIDPPMKDPQLMEHYGATTPKDLVNILFDAEANAIAGEIVELSGFKDDEDAEEEVKNSLDGTEM